MGSGWNWRFPVILLKIIKVIFETKRNKIYNFWQHWATFSILKIALRFPVLNTNIKVLSGLRFFTKNHKAFYLFIFSPLMMIWRIKSATYVFAAARLCHCAMIASTWMWFNNLFKVHLFTMEIDSSIRRQGNALASRLLSDELYIFCINATLDEYRHTFPYFKVLIYTT